MSKLSNVINNSDIGIIEQIQQLFDLKDTDTLQNNCAFTGWDNVYENISIQFAKILQTTFDNLSKQIKNGTKKHMNALSTSKNKYLAEIENIANRLKDMNVSETVIIQTQSPLLQHVETIQTEIDKWQHIQTKTGVLLQVNNAPIENEQKQNENYDWNNVKQLNLRGGSGGGGGQTQYIVNGIVVEASHCVLYFTPNPSYYHMQYMFNGDTTTAHGASNPANYCSNAFRTSFWLTHEPENARNQHLTFQFPSAIKLSYIDVYSNIGSMTPSGAWAPNCMYSIELLQNDTWSVFCEMVDTKDDVLGNKRVHHIRKVVDGLKFNLQLQSVGSYVVMKEIDFFVIK
eukprot:769890_1